MAKDIDPPYRFDPLQNPTNVKFKQKGEGDENAPWKRIYSGPYHFEENGGTALAGDDPNFLWRITNGFFAPPNVSEWVWHQGSYWHYEP